jgi:hypothetical protein
VLNLVWLASYPKSGNTWMRIFLTNLHRDGSAVADINDLDADAIASGRPLFDEIVGVGSGELPPDLVDRLRPRVYDQLASRAAASDAGWPSFHKAHDAYRRVDGVEPLFPASAGTGAVYIVRNPLDVAVSYAHHLGDRDYDRAIALMADPDTTFSRARDGQPRQLRQRIGSWSEHVRGWMDDAAAVMPLRVVRYEDLHLSPVRAFGDVVNFCGVDCDTTRLRRAIARATFDEAARQERERAFSECPPLADRFFRRGAVGDWTRELGDSQVARLLADHAAMMARLGYLDTAGAPVARPAPATARPDLDHRPVPILDDCYGA